MTRGEVNVMRGFLEAQQADAAALSAASALVTISSVHDESSPPQHYLAEFGCKGLIRTSAGQVVEAERFLVGIYFPPHYLRKASSFESLVWLAPREIFHPNIACPLICAGDGFMRRAPGLVEIAYQLYAIIGWSKYSAKDALNPAAAQWARRNQHRFPIDRRPLKRRVLDVDVLAAKKEGVA